MDSITRTTRICTFDQMKPELRNALRMHLAQYRLTEIESDILMCCETKSTRQKKGIFGGTEQTESAVLLTPRWLAWVDSTNRDSAAAGSAELKKINVRGYESSALYDVYPDTGLNVTGQYTDVNKTGMTFIAIGNEPDGKKFRETLQDAIAKA